MNPCTDCILYYHFTNASSGATLLNFDSDVISYVIVYNGDISIEYNEPDNDRSDHETQESNNSKLFHFYEYFHPNKGNEYVEATLNVLSESYVKVFIRRTSKIDMDSQISISADKDCFRLKNFFINGKLMKYYSYQVNIISDEKTIEENKCEGTYVHLNNCYKCKIPEAFYTLRISVRYPINLYSAKQK